MKKQIIITEENGVIEVKKFISDSKGKFQEIKDFDDPIESDRIFRMGIRQNKIDFISKKKVR